MWPHCALSWQANGVPASMPGLERLWVMVGACELPVLLCLMALVC